MLACLQLTFYFLLQIKNYILINLKTFSKRVNLQDDKAIFLYLLLFLVKQLDPHSHLVLLQDRTFKGIIIMATKIRFGTFNIHIMKKWSQQLSEVVFNQILEYYLLYRFLMFGLLREII